MKRNCSAVACNHTIGIGATFCKDHWPMIPSHLQQSISGLNKRARMEGAEVVQHRWMLAILQAREAVAKQERRISPPIAGAYLAQAEREQQLERKAA